MGKNHLDDPRLAELREKLFRAHRLSQLTDIKYAPAYEEWMDQVEDFAEGQVYCLILDEEHARLNTLRRRAKRGWKAIVHIKGQHMLLPSGYPGPELELRLKKALKVGRELEADEYEVIYVTSGAIHAGCSDVTLADSAANWLITNGVNPDQIVRHVTLKGGNDEDYQVAAMADADEAIAQIHVICSNNQEPRVLGCFLERGWIVDVHPVAYLGLDPDSIDGEPSAMTMDMLKPHHSIVGETLSNLFGVRPLFKSAEAAKAAEEATIARHEAEIVKMDAPAGSGEREAGTMKAPGALNDPNQYCSMER